MEPSFSNVKYGFNDSLCEPEEIYRNMLVSDCKLMTASEFEQLKFSFSAKPHEAGEDIDLNFTQADFFEVQEPFAKSLMQFAAHKTIAALDYYD